jgi:hypothetical protein
LASVLMPAQSLKATAGNCGATLTIGALCEKLVP